MNTTNVIYKNKCCVPGCNDRASKRHRFPKDVHLLKKWVENIKLQRLRELLPEEIYSAYYVCDRHFAEEYLVPGTRRGLRRDAVPTLYLLALSEEHVELEGGMVIVQTLSDLETNTLPSISKECTHVGDLVSSTSEVTETTAAENPHSCSSPIEIQHICPPRLSERRTRGILQSVNVTRQKSLTPKCRKFYKMVGQWGRRTAKIHYKMKNLQERLANAEKLANSPNFTNLMECVNQTTYTFIMQQVRNQNLRAKARRFTLDEKILSLTLLKGSGKGYRLLSKIFCLPSRKTLTNLLTNISLRPGINDHIVNSLKNIVSKLKNPNDKLCAVVFDEISLSPLLSYNRKHDCVDGVADFGNKRTPHIASCANVFMIKGICRQWKQPFSFTFSSGPTKSFQIKNMIKEVITSCQNIGLNVAATICDQGSCNQAAINALLKETNENCLRDGIENIYFGFLINGVEIIPIYDVPHLFKGMRNNLLNKNLYFEINGALKLAKWKHIEQFYMLDTMDETTLSTKLTDAHIFAKNMNKMKVSLMSQVFSHQVGSLIKRISQWDIYSEYQLEEEAEDTGDFILLMDKLFDSLNGNSKVAASSKPLKGAVTDASEHEEFWQTSIKVLQKMKFWNENENKFVKPPSLLNLIKTLKAFIYLKKILLKEMKFILPRALNQDCLENFFGSIRSHGVRNTSPDVNHFITSFKSLLLNNFMTSHSPGSNCENDFSTGALDDLRCFVTGEFIAGVRPLEDDDEDEHLPDIPASLSLVQKSRVAKSTIAYVAGYVARKVLKSTKNCQNCQNVLLHSDGNVELEVIEARQYQNSNLVKPGSYLCFATSQSLSRLFYLIPRLCHQNSNLFAMLKNIILKEVNFTVLNCADHKHIGDLAATLLIRCILYYWCKSVNKILVGKDEKFVKYLSREPNKTLIDPIKLQARKKYLKKIKKSKRQ